MAWWFLQVATQVNTDEVKETEFPREHYFGKAHNFPHEHPPSLWFERVSIATITKTRLKGSDSNEDEAGVIDGKAKVSGKMQAVARIFLSLLNPWQKQGTTRSPPSNPADWVLTRTIKSILKPHKRWCGQSQAIPVRSHPLTGLNTFQVKWNLLPTHRISKRIMLRMKSLCSGWVLGLLLTDLSLTVTVHKR